MHGNYAIVRASDNEVANVIVADDSYVPPSGYVKVLITDVNPASPGNLWNGIAFTKSQKQIDRELDDLRKERDALLRASDWTQLEDVSITIQEKQEWRQYRQQLRDLTSQVGGNPQGVKFPKKPNKNK